MKIIKSLLLLALPSLAIFSACQGQNGHTIKGTIQGAANLQATLEQSFFDRTTTALGRVTCDPQGNFTFEQKEPFAQGLYTLTIGAQKLFFMLDGKENTVEIKGELAKLARYEGLEVSGSQTFTCYANLVKSLYATPLTSPDQAKPLIEQKTCDPLMKAFFTIQLLGRAPAQFMTEIKAAGKELDAYLPGSKYATGYNTIVTQLEAQATGAQAAQAAASKIQVGQPAPEISLPDPNGKVRNLSDLKGKIVLLDFWASWCGPCRRANPHVVEIYNKYKSKGFDVFSVSLDRPDGKEKWRQAIAQDGLIWSNHVSDLQFWNCAPAQTYGVHSIPQTFLIGRDGKILAVNPRNNLEEELLKAL